VAPTYRSALRTPSRRLELGGGEPQRARET
jgi:hypothetical protein